MPSLLRAALAAAVIAAVPAVAAEPAQPYTPASDPAVAAQPQAAYDVAHRCETLRNAGDTAVTRTFHHEGATAMEHGKKVVDLNRELSVLRRVGGDYKIVLYIFNNDPVQGEG